jgi:hypothetical protein
MKHFLLIAVLFLSALAFADETGFGQLALSCNAVTTTGACTTFNVHPPDFVHVPQANSFTWQTIFSGGTPTSVTVVLQGSIDGTTFSTIDTSTSTAGETRTKAGAAYNFFRCNVTAYNRNGTAASCQITPQFSTSGASGAVDSVNGQTGTVVLAASDVGAAATSHTHAESDVTSLVSDLAAKVPTTRTVNGHALSANVTVTAGDVGAGDASTNTATSVDSEVAIFSSTTGKLLKRSALTGIIKQTAGVQSVASAGTDYVAPQTTLSGYGITDAVPNTVTVNGHALSSNVSVTAGDVGNSTAQWNANQINGVSLAGLATGIVKNTTTTGVPSVAVAGDCPTLNQNTSGNAGTATALAANPTDCASTNAYTTAIAASGNLTCSTWSIQEVPSGSINSSNTAFVLANTPVSGSVACYQNGLRVVGGASLDYTISGATMTWATAPTTGDTIYCDYRF